jgi:hypothetical protein
MPTRNYDLFKDPRTILKTVFVVIENSPQITTMICKKILEGLNHRISKYHALLHDLAFT